MAQSEYVRALPLILAREVDPFKQTTVSLLRTNLFIIKTCVR